MREIKFRAWDKKDKVMREVYGVLFKRISNKGNRNEDMVEMHCSDYEGSKAIILSHFERSLEDVSLMQFTGLLDRNGKDIYEGDIIKKKFNHGICNCEVIYEKGGYFIKNEKEVIKDNLHWHTTGLEVIGNIYENPELLK